MVSVKSLKAILQRAFILLSENNSVQTALIFVIFSIIVFIGFRSVLVQSMLAYSDMSPFPINISQALEVIHSSWQPPIGAFWFSSIDLVIAIRIIYMLMTFGNPVLAQKLFIIIPYVLSFTGFYLVLRKYTNSKIARFFGAFIYAINPMTITVFLGGAMGWIYVHGILPFLFLLMLKISEEKFSKSIVKFICLFGVLFAVALSMGGQIILFVLPFFFFVLYTSLQKKNLLHFVRVFSLISIAFLIGIILSLPVFLPIGAELLSYTNPGSVSAIDVEMNYKYEHSMDPILSILSLQPTELDVFGWDSTPSMVIISLAIPLLAFSAILVRRKWPDFVVFGLILAISTILFTYFGYLGITLPLFRYFRFLEVLPVSNAPSLLLVFPYGLLIGYVLDTFFSEEFATAKKGMFLGKRPLHIVSVFFILIIMFSINWPLFTGSMGLFTLRTETEATMPSEFYEITQWLNEKRKTDPFARSLWVPYSYNDVEINIKYLDQQSVIASRSLNRYVTTNYTKYSNEVFRKVFVDQTSTFAGALLGPLSVKYIILWQGSQQTGLPRFVYEREGIIGLVGSPDEFQKILSNQRDLEIVMSSDTFTIYENMQYIPHLSVLKNGANLISNAGISMETVVDVMALMGSLPPSVRPNTPLLLDSSTQVPVSSQIQLVENETFSVTEDGDYVIFFNSDSVPLVFLDNVPQNSTNLEGTYISEIFLQAGTHNLTIIEKPRSMPEPVLWWKFDEGSGNLVSDYSPNFLDGTISGDFVWVDAQNRFVPEFQGNGIVDLKELRGVMNESYTIAIVAEFDTVGDNPIFRTTAEDPADFVGAIAFGGRVLVLGSQADYQFSLESDTELDIRNPFHIAVGRDIQNQFFLAVNGRLEKTTADLSAEMTGYKYLMVAPGMYGRIYDLRVYDIALSEADIAYLNRGTDVLKLKPKAVIFKPENIGLNSSSDNFKSELQPEFVSTALYMHELLLNPHGTAFIYLAEPFDSRWIAYYENGTKLEHMMAYDGMNAFLAQGHQDERIVVFFEEQSNRDTLLRLWVVSWAFTLGLMFIATDKLLGLVKDVIIKLKNTITRRASKS